MALPTLEQAKGLLQQGKITPETYQKITGIDSSIQDAGAPVGGVEQSPPMESVSTPMNQNQAVEPAAPTFWESIRNNVAEQTKPGTSLGDIKTAIFNPQPTVESANKQVIANSLSTEPSGSATSSNKESENLNDDSDNPFMKGVKSGLLQSGSKNNGFYTASVKNRLNGIEQGYNQEQNALQLAADVGTERAVEEAAFSKELSDRLDSQEKMRQQEHQNRLKATEEARQKLDNVIQSVQNDKIDPNRLWNSKTTGEKVLSMIVMTLGAFGATKDGVNSAVEKFNRDVEMDINAQKANIQNKAKGVEMATGAYKDLLDLYKNENQADAATRATLIANSEYKLRSAMAKTGNKLALAKGNELLAKLQQERELQMLKLEQATMAKPIQIDKSTFSDAHELSQEFEKAGIPARNELLQQVSNAVSLNGPLAKLNAPQRMLVQDYIKTGDRSKIAGFLSPNADPEIRKASQALMRFYNEERHRITGSASSEKEANQILQSYFGDGTPEEIQATVQAQRQMLNAQINNIRSGHSEKANQIHELRQSVYSAANKPAALDLRKPR